MLGTLWEETAERIAEAIRWAAETKGRNPPSAIAAKLQFSIDTEKLADGLDGYHIEGTKMIVVTTGYKPRQEMTIAHELAEAYLPERLGPDLHERFCNRCAAALALPRTEYIASLTSCGWDLSAMRRQWPWASWELLARRAADLLPGVTAAAWVDEQPKWRSQETEPTSAEHEALVLAYKKGKGRALVATSLALAWSLSPKGAKSRAISICLPVVR